MDENNNNNFLAITNTFKCSNHITKISILSIFVLFFLFNTYILSVFGGTTKIAVGENGGVVTISPKEHILLGNKEKCIDGYKILTTKLENVKIKNVFDRMTEVVLERSFDIELGKKILKENKLELDLSDSKYSFHINNRGINKATGLA